jgi:hypothetical protein
MVRESLLVPEGRPPHFDSYTKHGNLGTLGRSTFISIMNLPPPSLIIVKQPVNKDPVDAL